VLIYIRFKDYCSIVIAGSRIIRVPIQVEPIFGVRNDIRCANIITLCWVTVDCSDSADIYNVNFLSLEDLCR
jgi:hypothetical protein